MCAVLLAPGGGVGGWMVTSRSRAPRTEHPPRDDGLHVAFLKRLAVPTPRSGGEFEMLVEP